MAQAMAAEEGCCRKRSVGCTAMNEQSSRSHMVFTLRIDGRKRRKGAIARGKRTPGLERTRRARRQRGRNA
jgi:hypothetical protein